jgi:SPP1 gp7 family putative phage head morphogenesis protein
MKTSRNDLIDTYLKHQINIGRFSNYEVRRLLDILDRANIQALDIISKTNGIDTKRKFELVSAYIKELSDLLNKKLYGTIEQDFKELAAVETRFVQKTLNTVGVKLELDLPAPEKLWAAANFTGYADTHETFKKYLDDLSENFYKTWSSNIRMGYINGLTAQQINRQVLGSLNDLEPGEMKTIRKSLTMNTRTMIAEMSTMARNETYRQNESLFSGYRYIGVLDDRQCLICGSLDQTVFKTLDEMPHLPQHRNCRCIAIPEIKGMEGFDDDDMRASVDGEVPAKMNYSDWLEKQDAETQKDILGVSRYEMYKNGTKIKAFVSDGRLLTLKELENS